MKNYLDCLPPLSDVVILLLALVMRVMLLPPLCKWSVTGRRGQGTPAQDPAEVCNGAKPWTPTV